MCGLAAMFSYRENAPPVDVAELVHVRDAMARRGPDGSGLWVSLDGNVGLAHRRLAIIDLTDAGAQPMVDGEHRIVFNGEIYNYRQLRQQLEGDGYKFRSHSDTEVLLKLYGKYGEKMVHHLRGMFAFVIWDAARNGLFMARDHLGIKPLYYADDGKTIKVASQVRALLAGGSVDTSPEPAGHVGFFLWGHVPDPYTCFRGIKALAAGSTLWVQYGQQAVVKRYFELTDYFARNAASSVLDVDEAQAVLRAALLDSVRHHLESDVPVGVFLSSGLDSTTLAALTREVDDGPLHSVTLAFDEYLGQQLDEAPLAELVSGHLGTLHSTRRIGREEFVEEALQVVALMDQPSTDGINTYFVSKAAAEAGLKVALSGLGGDEIFGGYPSFRQVPRMVKMFAPLRHVPGLGRGFRIVSSPLIGRFTSPKYAGLLEYGGTFGGAYLLRRGMFMPWELPEVLDAELVKQGWVELRALGDLDSTAHAATDHLRVMALELSWYMRNQLLRDTDWASMAHSLEVRVPFVDINLVGAVARLTQSGFTPTKSRMAKTPAAPLPDAILSRPKTGFAVPVREWLLDSRGSGSRRRGLRGWALEVWSQYAQSAGARASLGRTT